jgi:hypothetical protein
MHGYVSTSRMLSDIVSCRLPPCADKHHRGEQAHSDWN